MAPKQKPTDPTQLCEMSVFYLVHFVQTVSLGDDGFECFQSENSETPNFLRVSQKVASLCRQSAYVFCTAWLLTSLLPARSAAATNTTIQFNRDIRRILADNCFPCHGFDANKRKADLRLDTPEGATADHKGHQAIKPGDLESSELWKR